MTIADLTIAGRDLDVSSVSGRIALCEPWRLRVDAQARGDAPEPADLVGATFQLVIRDTHGEAVTVHGLVTGVERAVDLVGGAPFAIELGPPTAKLEIGRDSRVFQDLDALEILRDVLARGGIDDVVWRTTASYAKWPYRVQYRESDWAFLTRVCAEEGIAWWHDLDDDATRLVLCDDTTTSPPIDGDPGIPCHESTGLRATSAAVYVVTKRSRLVHDAVTLRDYDFEKPKLSLESKSGSGSRELYDFPGRFRVPADGDRLARARLEGLRGGRIRTRGRTSTVRMRVGRTFELTDHPVESLNENLFVEALDLRVAEPRGGATDVEGLQIAWTARPAGVQCRPELDGSVIRQPRGPQTGVVVGPSGQEIHTDGQGRVRVQLYWDRLGARDDKASTWMRVGQFALGGSMIVPRVGWDVLVHHHEGDIDQPHVSGHLYDGQFPVPYPLPQNKTRTSWQTATTPGGGSTNEIRFEDAKGSEEMFINASKDMNTVVGDNKTEKVGAACTETIGADRKTTIGSNLQLGVKADQAVTIGGAQSLSVSGSRSVAVNGSETTTIGGSRTVTAITGSSIEGQGGRAHTVGGTLMAASGLGVNRMILGSLAMTVGGAWVRAAATGLSDITGGAEAETIGGAKVHAGAAGASVSVTGAAAETVGGAYVITAGGNAGETATGPLAVTVGGAFLGNAPSIEIEADAQIVVQVGGASLTIDPSSVEIKAPSILAPAGSIDKAGSKIEHN